MGKKSPGDKHYVVDYHLSSHLGFCHGPVDAFKGLFFRERQVTIPTLTNFGRFTVDVPTLFGDTTKEGGVHGQVLFMPGHPDQILPNDLASRFQAGATGADLPGFRGLTTLAFIGAGKNGQPGFNVGSNYPQVPIPWARFARSSRTLSDTYAVIDRGGWIMNNPAHMIHECLVNPDFGMGGAPSMIDNTSFLEAAQVLYNEGFGLGAVWTRQARIENFIQEILDHINAMFFFNPRTGLAQIKLIRNDYDVNTLDEIDDSKFKVISFRRKLWGETVNEIVVNYTDPNTNDNKTMVYQDLGNIAMQGEVVSEPRNYDMICDDALASFVGARDILAASMPTATCVIEAKRSEWDRLPGEVLKFTSNRYGADKVVMRVMDVDYGKPDNGKLRITLLEDLFQFGQASYVEPPTSEWEEPGSIPGPLEAKVIAMPKTMNDWYYNVSDDEYPRATPAILVSPDEYDVRRFILNYYGVLATGEEKWLSDGIKPTVGKFELAAPLAFEASTVNVLVTDVVGGLAPQVTAVAMIGDGTDAECEFVMFEAYNGNDEWNIIRGIYDTIPREWPAGTIVRIFTGSFAAVEWHERLAGFPFQYRLQSISSKGTLPFEDAPPDNFQIVARPHFPYRPANVQIDGVGYGQVDYSDDLGPRPNPHYVTVSWSNRNRLSEDAIVRRWTDGNVAPEDGQTTEIIVTSIDGLTEHYRVTGLTGTSYQLDDAEYAPHEDVLIKVISKRDGLESLQGHSIRLTLRTKGFGADYGYGYGGWEGY